MTVLRTNRWLPSLNARYAIYLSICCANVLIVVVAARNARDEETRQVVSRPALQQQRQAGSIRTRFEHEITLSTGGRGSLVDDP